MAKPPPDVDREKFITGDGLYTSGCPAVPYDDSNEFRFDPAPTPVAGIVVGNLLIVSFAGPISGIFFALAFLSDFSERALAVAVLVGAMGACMCLVYTATTVSQYTGAQRQGPWLIVDKQNDQVALPREGLEFDLSDVVHLQYITTKHLNRDAYDNNRCSELNLVTCVDNERKRWPILRRNANVNAFDYLVHPLVNSTRVPAVRIEDDWFGWTTTETHYENAHA